MGKTLRKGENPKKIAGNARKQEQLNKKVQEELSKLEASESAEWSKGAKKANKKKEELEAKKQEALRKKQERERLLKEEEASLPQSKGRRKGGAVKMAVKKNASLDAFLKGNDVDTYNASGLSSALDALDLLEKDSGVSNKDIDRHPERRFKAAYNAYEARRLPEIKSEKPGLRLVQVKELIYKEFQKSPENPFNQHTINFNASQAEMNSMKQSIRHKKELQFTQ
ncbi:coiled-coil domain-containing protein 124 [Ascoidea rubescens DSM 1968]|uniref:DUF1014-domain-containing protein n=1 Tax=Ascoidea rubescens DSM 1968 TaxID=1344418 RepID=A0A1D2VCU7_9ASCO|nr:DUF1014-domain-containing protein [Ascoidea rubescens DSM 1968]ODV59340.1 DUF1014-domain-containing protein [Ascoidea rubescens DSM 1968]